jgi:hypothetical protein
MEKVLSIGHYGGRRWREAVDCYIELFLADTLSLGTSMVLYPSQEGRASGSSSSDYQQCDDARVAACSRILRASFLLLIKMHAAVRAMAVLERDTFIPARIYVSSNFPTDSYKSITVNTPVATAGKE